MQPYNTLKLSPLKHSFVSEYVLYIYVLLNINTNNILCERSNVIQGSRKTQVKSNVEEVFVIVIRYACSSDTAFSDVFSTYHCCGSMSIAMTMFFGGTIFICLVGIIILWSKQINKGIIDC